MLEFTRMVTTWYGHIDNLSTPALLRLFKGGAMLAKLFTRGKSRTPVVGERDGRGECRLELNAWLPVRSTGPRLAVVGLRLSLRTALYPRLA